MRSFRATLGYLAVFLMLAPAPAQAWWGWLDDLSGPGKFKGPQFDFRLACFGPESEVQRLVDDLKNANVLTRKLIDVPVDPAKPEEKQRNLVQVPTADFHAAHAAWRNLIADLNATQARFPVLKSEDLKAADKQVNDDLNVFTARKAEPPESARPTADALPTVVINPTVLETALGKWNGQFRPFVDEVIRGVSSIGSTGILISACSTNIVRRSSIELDLDFWKADGAPGFANSNRILLTTLMPVFSFRVFTDPRFDFVDAGVGAGAYWFTSKGFDSFSGVVLQPIRLDFHAPTLWSTYRLRDRSRKRTAKDARTEVLRRIAAAPTFRFSVMEFPAGFSADAFAGTGEHHVRIAGELLKSWSLFINLEPFARKLPFVNSTK
jgi:hypothetical protein